MADSIWTGIEDAFVGAEDWLGGVLSNTTSLVTSIKADINYLQGEIPAGVAWFGQQIQTIYNQVQGWISLAESALASGAAIVTTVYNAAKAALAALAEYFETTGTVAPGGSAA